MNVWLILGIITGWVFLCASSCMDTHPEEGASMCDHDFDQRGVCKHCGVTWEVAMAQQPQPEPDWAAPDGPDEDAELVGGGVIDEQCSDCGGHAEPFVDAYVILCPPERIPQHDGRQGFVICKRCWDKMIGEVMLQRLR